MKRQFLVILFLLLLIWSTILFVGCDNYIDGLNKNEDGTTQTPSNNNSTGDTLHCENGKYLSSSIFKLNSDNDWVYTVDINVSTIELKNTFTTNIGNGNYRFYDIVDGWLVERNSIVNLTLGSNVVYMVIDENMDIFKIIVYRGASSSNATELDHDHVYFLCYTKEPTCEQSGKQAYVCDICGKTQNETTVPAEGHSWKNNYVQSFSASCTAEGKKVQNCTACGDTKVETIPKSNHIWYLYDECDSTTNEIVFKLHCLWCETKTASEFRFKVSDVVKLSGFDGDYGDLDYTIHFDQTHSQEVQKAPYYRVYISSTEIFIARHPTKLIGRYEDMYTDKTLEQYYEDLGCDILLKATYVETEDGVLTVIENDN